MKVQIESLAGSIMYDTPGIDGLSLVKQTAVDYSIENNGDTIETEKIFEVLDEMIERGDVFFDEAEDAWYFSDSNEARQAVENYLDKD